MFFKMKTWKPISLVGMPKCKNDSYFWIQESRYKGQIKHFFVNMILISEIKNSEIRMTSTLMIFLPGWQVGRISFRKPIIPLEMAEAVKL